MSNKSPKISAEYALIIQGAKEFSVLALSIAAAFGSIFLAMKFGDRSVSDDSAIEYIELGLLCINIVAFLWLGRTRQAYLPFALIAAGFFLGLCIRELDEFFDQIVHGFWKVPVLFLLAIMGVYFYRNVQPVLRGLADFIAKRHFGTVAVGMVLLLVFSRLFGMKELWQMAMEDNYQRVVKNLAEEGLELMAYTIIAFGNVMVCRGLATSPDGLAEKNY